MKKWQIKMLAVNQQTNLDTELNALGQEGWRLAHMVETPFGVKFLLERQLDEEVPVNKDAELLKKFGV